MYPFEYISGVNQKFADPDVGLSSYNYNNRRSNTNTSRSKPNDKHGAKDMYGSPSLPPSLPSPDHRNQKPAKSRSDRYQDDLPRYTYVRPPVYLGEREGELETMQTISRCSCNRWTDRPA